MLQVSVFLQQQANSIIRFLSNLLLLICSLMVFILFLFLLFRSDEDFETPIVVIYDNGEEFKRLSEQLKAGLEHELSKLGFKRPPDRDSTSELVAKKLRVHATSLHGDSTTSDSSKSTLTKGKQIPEELKSLSKMKISTASKLFGLNIEKLLGEEQHDLSKLIKLRRFEDNPEKKQKLQELREACHSELSQIIGVDGYPVHTKKENLQSLTIRAVIRKVIYHIRREYSVTSQLRFLEEERCFTIKLDKLTKTVRPDLLVVGEREGEELYYLAIVECKRGLVEEGIKQLVIYMKEIVYRLNGDKKPVYGLATNGTHFSLAKYDPQNPDKPDETLDKDFLLLESSRFVFRRMEEYKEDWLKGNSVIVDIILSILLEKLGK